MYILIEGIDTSGKSTQAELLVQNCENTIATKEPGGTKFGLHVRDLILNGGFDLDSKSELFLFLADRAEHYAKIIAPNKDKYDIISDRGFISGISYALNNGAIDKDFLTKLNQFALNGDLPDLIVFIRTNETLLLDRLGEQEKDNIEKRGTKYLLDIQDTMEQIINNLHVDTLFLDAKESVDELHTKIKNKIKELK